MTPELKIMSVALTLGPAVQAGEPTLLFQLPPDTTMAATDGTRFLLAVPSKASTRVPITVMLNWPAALRK